MGIKFSNLATTTLASGITNSATTITVADGSVFPALGSGDFFFASIDTPPNAPEIVKVTAISSNTLTVVRGQDGTTATSHNSSETIALRVVAAALEDLRDNAGETYTAGSGITLTGTTFSNSAPDQTVSLTGSGATSVSGAYPNFTISSTDTNTNTTYTAGTNLSLSGTTFNLNTNLSGLGTISSGAITATGDINLNGGNLTRNAHNTGHLEGSYNSVGSSNNISSNPIYTIGSSYNPATTTLGSMYGIGFTKSNASFISGDLDAGGSSGWGMYVASDGDARVFLNASDGTINSTGQHYADGSLVWNAGNDGSGSGLDADLLDGNHASAFLTTSNDRIFITDTRSANRAPSYYDDRYVQADFTQSTNLGVSGGDTWSAVLTASPWSSFDPGHRQQQFIFAGTSLFRRTASSDSAWGSTYKLWDSGNDGSGSGLDADLLDGLQASSLVRSDAADTMSGTYTFTGGHGALNITNSSILSSASSSWTGDPGGSGKIQYHSNRWYIVADSSSNKILQFRRNNADKSYIDNNGTLVGGGMWSSYNDGSGSGLDADTVDGVQGSSLVRSDAITSMTSAGIGRNNHHLGHLVGSYNNVGANSTKTNPIYSIGTNYLPSATALNNHYGIGYSHSSFWGSGNGKPSGWGMYVTEGGTVRGIMAINGTWSQAEFNRNGNKVWDAGNDGSGSGLDADLLDGQHGSYYALLDHFRSTGNSNYTSTTTSALTTEAFGDGSMKSYLSAHKTGWSYAGNGNLTDAGRLTELAGTSWLWWTDNSGDSTSGNHTALCIAPNTGGSAGKMFVYNNQGSSYAPGWREIWTSTSDGSGSGLDADTVDGIQGSTLREGSYSTDYYVNALYHDDWVRNHTNTNGHYWSTTGWHLYPKDADDFYLRAGSGSCGLALTVGNATARGYVYANPSNQIGFLNSSRNWSFKVDNSGNATATGNVTAYSDRRLKSDIEPLTNSLNTVCQLQGVKYKRNSTGATEIGFVAQDVKKVVPELVDIIDSRTENSDGVSDGIEDLHVMKYQNTVALLVESIKELKAEVDDLKEQLRTK